MFSMTISSMLMALRFVPARPLSACGRLLVSTAAATTTTVASMAPMPAVAEQVHTDEQDEKHHPNPVLR
ncbi:hypothetical protein [Thiobacillus sp.]